MQNSFTPDLEGSTASDLDAAYREMARDTVREAEALEWAEGILSGIEDGYAEEDPLAWQ